VRLPEPAQRPRSRTLTITPINFAALDGAHVDAVNLTALIAVCLNLFDSIHGRYKYQGTSLLGPYRALKELGFSPCCMAHPAKNSGVICVSLWFKGPLTADLR